MILHAARYLFHRAVEHEEGVRSHPEGCSADVDGGVNSHGAAIGAQLLESERVWRSDELHLIQRRVRPYEDRPPASNG